MNIMKFPTLLLALLLLLAACYPSAPSVPAVTAQPVTETAAPSPAPTSPPAPTRTPTPTPTQTPTPASARLPHSLYFLYGTQYIRQVWRIVLGSPAMEQVTDEALGVEDFAVSPVDGSLAFITTQNQLYLVDGSGTNRQLIADDSQLEPDKQGTYEFGMVINPVFSRDGKTLAYGFGGLHLYDLLTGEDTLLLENMGNLLGTPAVFTHELYAPTAWSPDGSMLLFSMAYFEGSTLAIFQPGLEQPFRRLHSNGPVCCQYQWTSDSRTVLVSNPSFGTRDPGLWSFDARTGEETLLLGGMPEDGTMDFVASPVQLASGDLLFFYSELERFNPDVGIPLKLVRSDPNGSNITQLRPEEFSIFDVLWTADGSLAVFPRGCCGKEIALVMVRPDGSPLEVLLEAGEGFLTNLEWGP